MFGKEASESPRTASLSLSSCFSVPATLSLSESWIYITPCWSCAYSNWLVSEHTGKLFTVSSKLHLSGGRALPQSKLVLQWVNWQSDGFFSDCSTLCKDLILFSFRARRFFLKVLISQQSWAIVTQCRGSLGGSRSKVGMGAQLIQ